MNEYNTQDVCLAAGEHVDNPLHEADRCLVARLATIQPREYFKPQLADYAAVLQAAGFTVYRHKHPTMRAGDTPLPSGYFVYSREVDGQILFGIVQEGDFPRLGQGLEHHMPIKPSREHGSAMHIDIPYGQRPLGTDTVEYAELITRPRNTNLVVGTHANYFDAADLERRFVVLDPIIDEPTEGYLLVPVTGPTRVLAVADPSASLSVLQAGVGGYVELHTVDGTTMTGAPIDMWLHEEGKYEYAGQPNPRAQYLWDRTFGRGTDSIMGPAVLTAVADSEGDTGFLTEDDITSIRASFDMLGFEV